jgi:hypothetical protein
VLRKRPVGTSSIAAVARDYDIRHFLSFAAIKQAMMVLRLTSMQPLQQGDSTEVRGIFKRTREFVSSITPQESRLLVLERLFSLLFQTDSAVGLTAPAITTSAVPLLGEFLASETFVMHMLPILEQQLDDMVTDPAAAPDTAVHLFSARVVSMKEFVAEVRWRFALVCPANGIKSNHTLIRRMMSPPPRYSWLFFPSPPW